MAFKLGTLQELKRRGRGEPTTYTKKNHHHHQTASIYIQRALNFKRFSKKPRASCVRRKNKLLGTLNEVRMLLRRQQADAKLLPRGTESSKPFDCQKPQHLLPPQRSSRKKCCFHPLWQANNTMERPHLSPAPSQLCPTAQVLPDSSHLCFSRPVQPHALQDAFCKDTSHFPP